jgi:hypothetical protein
MNNGEDPLVVLARHARLDTAVEANDAMLARLMELYGPPATSEQQVILPADLLAALGLPPQSVTLPAEPLHPQRASLQTVVSRETTADPARAAIKAWLDGESVNRQSLLRLRRGIARWLRAVYPVEGLHAPGVARPHNVLRWRRVHLGVRPPIILEGVDEEEGILVTREIGLVAFRLHDYATTTGDEAKLLASSLAQEERLIPLLFTAADYQQQVMDRLEDQLGVQIEELALALYTWLVIVEGPPDERLPGFGDDFWSQVETARTQLPLWRRQPDEELCQAIRHLFEDFFKLRDNVCGGPKVAWLTGRCMPYALLETLTCIDLERLDRDYRLGATKLGECLGQVQKMVVHWKELKETKLTREPSRLSPACQEVMERLLSVNERGIPLSEVSKDVQAELRHIHPALFKALQVILTNPCLPWNN